MNALAILFLFISQQQPQSSPLTAVDCHRLVGISVVVDYSKTSISDMSNGRKALGICVSERGEDMTKLDLVGAFAALQFIDNEISRRQLAEVKIIQTSILQAQKECGTK